MAASRLDQLYRRLLVTRFYTKGWGKPEDLKRLLEFRKILSNREMCSKLVPPDYPITIHQEFVSGDCRILEGSFLSPFVHQLPGLMPKEVETARFQVVVPAKWTKRHRGVCLQLAGTGDHGFWRRRTFIARPLIKEANIGSILLENPYYGVRKPRPQLRSSLQNVIDLFIMGGALVLESAALLHWCELQGYGPLGITGVSMGGHMASLAATNWPKPISLIPCLSWSTASSVWTQGVLSGAVSWRPLQQQYGAQPSYSAEIAELLTSNHWLEREKATRGQHLCTASSGTRNSTAHGGRWLEQSLSSAVSQNNRLPAAASFGPSASFEKAAAVSSATRSDRGLRQLVAASSRPPPQREVVGFMHDLMNECTHLSHFAVPVDPSLAIVVAARHDAYIPRDGVIGLDELWPGCEVRFVEHGHITAALFSQAAFRSAIIDSFNLQMSKYGF